MFLPIPMPVADYEIPTNPNRPVQIGDVGFIHEGRFHRLFSALLSADNPLQERGVPEYHEPLPT
jgi:hypothetical protein